MALRYREEGLTPSLSNNTTVEPSIMTTIWGMKYWPLQRGTLHAVGTKVSGHYREDGHTSGMAIKRCPLYIYQADAQTRYIKH